MTVQNLLLAGVGGQGAVLAAKLLGTALLDQGHDVKVSEVHGMAQRGGSIVTQIRYGQKVFSPTIVPGEAQFLVAFEALEALRWNHYLAGDGVLVSDTAKIAPPTVTMGEAVYPNVNEALGNRNVLWIPALDLANQLGNWRTANVVLLGFLSRYLPIDELGWQRSLTAVIKPEHLEVNRHAFKLGREFLI